MKLRMDVTRFHDLLVGVVDKPRTRRAARDVGRRGDANR
jgi:hypothetical protein